MQPWPLPEVKTKDSSRNWVLGVRPGVKGRVRPEVHGWRAGCVELDQGFGVCGMLCLTGLRGGSGGHTCELLRVWIISAHLVRPPAKRQVCGEWDLPKGISVEPRGQRHQGDPGRDQPGRGSLWTGENPSHARGKETNFPALVPRGGRGCVDRSHGWGCGQAGDQEVG